MDAYKARFANPNSAAERGYIGDVIEPRDTRRKLIRALHTLQTKRVAQPQRKHGNIPLQWASEPTYPRRFTPGAGETGIWKKLYSRSSPAPLIEIVRAWGA